MVDNAAGGKDTYILYLNPQLPLLGPIRELSSIRGLTPITEPILGAIEPLLRLVVDMAYTDRTYENAEVHTRFSLITPPDKIIEALRWRARGTARGLDQPALRRADRTGRTVAGGGHEHDHRVGRLVGNAVNTACTA